MKSCERGGRGKKEGIPLFTPPPAHSFHIGAAVINNNPWATSSATEEDRIDAISEDATVAEVAPEAAPPGLQQSLASLQSNDALIRSTQVASTSVHISRYWRCMR